MNKVKVIPLGDGTGREVNPYNKTRRFFIKAKMGKSCYKTIPNEIFNKFEAEHPPLPLLLNNEPFMEKGVVVECEKVIRFKVPDTGRCYIPSSSGDDEHEWVYSIITAPVKEECCGRCKPTVEEMARPTNIVELFKQVCREEWPYENDQELEDYHNYNFKWMEDKIVSTCIAYADEKATAAEADFKKKALEILEGLRLSLDRFGYNQALNDVKNKIEQL